MGEKKFTLIELHLDGDTQFGLGTIDSALPFDSSDDDAEAESEYETADATDEASDAEAEDGSGGKAIGALVALVVLVAAGVAAKKFRGDDEPELEEEEQPDVIVN
ncbi:hypothetical protein SAMN04487967_2320 [Natronorubrum sediminis]|uniref:Uncharacterized protein n=1 Tax=Natronorubrum sediminis TaxID=640943 RepID=A0A1H6G1R0_9EURY|nr:hypothetical protein [Natronorubrum sediminis]SEH15934.1 hypothetical protein SAMN04487967_2320 [Natronorubrum sediminis]